MSTNKFLIFMTVVLALLGLTWGIDQADAQWAPGVVVPPGAAGFNPNVDYNVPNFAYSPNIRKFVNALPGLGFPGCTVGNPVGTGTCNENNLGQYIPIAQPDTTTYAGDEYYVIGATPYTIKMHSDLPPTTLRGYRQENATDPRIQNINQYLGPVIIARSYDPSKPKGDAATGNGRPVRVLLKNELPTSATIAGNLFLPVDPTIMGAGPGPNGGNYTQNRIATHLHGGATPWISDGTPHQWLTPTSDPTPYKKGDSLAHVPDMVVTAGQAYPALGSLNLATPFPGTCVGNPACITPAAGDGLSTHYYTNQQSSRLMFYHDHAYGITRLNVYAGLAAGYLLVDQVEDDMIDGSNKSGAFTVPRKVLPNLVGNFGEYKYGIPLVIQDKTFVNDATTPPGPGFPATGIPTYTTLFTDPRWYCVQGGACKGASGIWAAGTTPPPGGKLWLPHEYMPNQDIYDPSGANPLGRWDYGPWLNPPAVPLNATLPSPTITPEAFMDTMLVNGTPFPYVTLPPTAVRFRILNACNDRTLNLQLYVADPANPTEVTMVPAQPNPAAPTWPIDGRAGGVPDPATAGPTMVQLGNEGGLLPQVAEIPPQPVVFEQSRLLPTVLGIAKHALLVMPAERADIVVDFSGFKGKTLILYNDAPAASPLFDDRYDIYTDAPDFRSTGGAPPSAPGFGPNTRTIMQIRVANSAQSAPFDLAALKAALPQAYKASQPPPIVPQAAYNQAFGTTNKDIFVNNTDSTVNLLGTAQGVSSVITTLGGSGYSLTPPVGTPPLAVSFVPANGETITTPAAATAGLDGVTAITVTLGATSTATPYTLPPTVAIAAPTGCVIDGTTCVQATAVASISGGVVTAITVTDPGAGYTAECTAATNPAVTITTAVGDLTGAGATAASGLTCGAVAHIQVTNGGAGYTKAPLVYITGGGGTGATADARLTNDTVIGMKNITEGFDVEYGRINVQLGTTPVPLDPFSPAPAVPGIARYIDPPSDIWADGQPYIFRLAHLGVDNHANHFHLVNLQVINRVDVTNTMLPPEPNELGWKETIRTEPLTDLILAVRPKSQVLPFLIPTSNRLLDVTTLAGSTANFIQPAPVPGTPTAAGISNVVTSYGWEYVWHCHLLGHEENDMMRPIVFLAPTAPPGAPTLAAAQPNPGAGVVLTWTYASGNEHGFRLYRCLSGGACNPITTGTIATSDQNLTTFTDTTAATGLTYRYQLIAFNSVGDSPVSNIATITVAAVGAPSLPTNLTATASTLSADPPKVTLNWTDNSTNEFGFTIERATNAGFTAGLTSFNVAANVTTLTDSSVAAATTYYYRVRANNVAGPSNNANAVPFPVTTAGILPAAPTNLIALAAGPPLQVNLVWRDNSNNETGFRIERAISGGAFAALTTTGPNVTAFSDTTAVQGLIYSYRVFAINALGDSLASNTATTGALTVTLSAPTNLVAHASAPAPKPPTVSLSWTNNSPGATSFTILRSTNSSFLSGLDSFAVGANVTTFIDTTVSANTTYFYRVIALSSNEVSPPSNTATATTVGLPTIYFPIILKP